jgi:hypothetical protein
MSYTKWWLFVYISAGLRTRISVGADTTAIWPRLHRRPGIAQVNLCAKRFYYVTIV